MEEVAVTNVFDEAAAVATTLFIVAVIKSAVNFSSNRFFPLLSVLVALPITLLYGLAAGESYDSASLIATLVIQSLTVALAASGGQGWLRTYVGADALAVAIRRDT